MQHINWNKADEIVCKALGKFGVNISYGLDNTPEDVKNHYLSRIRWVKDDKENK